MSDKPKYTFRDLWDEHAEWSRRTFGADDARGPSGPLLHLAREAVEVVEVPGDLSEHADCLLLGMDACRRAGMTADDFAKVLAALTVIIAGEPEDWYSPLMSAARTKLAVNKARQWGQASADAPVFHTKEAPAHAD